MYRIFLIDDEPKILKSLTELLKKEFSTEAETNAFSKTKDLLDYSADFIPDILITDIRMPGTDGLALCGELKKLNPFLKIIIISGYGLFEYAHTAISLQVSDYLLKPIDREQLIKVIKREIKDLDELFDRPNDETETERMYRHMLLRAIYLDNAEAISWLRDYGCDHNPMFMVLFEYKSARSKHGVVLEWNINKIPLDFHCKEIFIQLSPYRYAFICSFTAHNYDAVLKKLEQQLTSINDCYVGISRVIHSCADFRKAYLQALSAAKFEIYDSTPHIVIYEEKGNDSVPDDSCFVSVLNEWIRDDFAALDTCVDNLFLQIRAIRLPLFSLKAFLESFMMKFTPLLLRSGFAEHDWEEFERKIRFLDRYHSLNDIEHDFRKFMNDVKNKNKTLKSNRLEQSFAQAVLYMKQHFSERLSLNEVAEHVGLNSAYFSTNFKKYTGSYFSNYLMELRIENAKSLLRDPGLKINDVAEASGIPDSRYFAKVFKKSVGITPSEYRNILWQMDIR